MFFGLFKKKNGNGVIIERQYGELTTAARTPAFYQSFNAPDTVMGRFEMISVMLILYFRRTAKSPRSGQEIAQEIIDAFFEDLDHSIRELGIGDLSVPKRMKKLAGMFFGRLESYAKAMDDKDGAALAAALKRNFHPLTQDDGLSMEPLARYMLETEEKLALMGEDRIDTGQLVMPRPADTLTAAG